jgi:Inhibitor of Apoptosis domain
MERFEGRIATYEGDPGDMFRKLGIEPHDLAMAGLYHLGGSRDRVGCPWCKVVLCGWVIGDNPLVQHMRHSVGCDWVKKRLDAIKKSAESPRDSYIAVVILVIGLLAVYFVD